MDGHGNGTKPQRKVKCKQCKSHLLCIHKNFSFDCECCNPGILISAHRSAQHRLLKQKSMLGGFAAQEDLDLQEAEEETGDKRLVQLAEKTANQKSERGRVSASLVAAKARADVDGHTKEKAKEITAAFLNAAKRKKSSEV
jgi:hypothetical protein